MNYLAEVHAKGEQAKEAARLLATLPTLVKNRALLAMADGLLANTQAILAANAADLENGKARGLSQALLDRLMLNETRVRSMAEGLREIAALPDPIGEIIEGWRRPNGLEIVKARVPLGVIGIIYEARPNVKIGRAHV
mgnify:CR=1 FL=1